MRKRKSEIYAIIKEDIQNNLKSYAVIIVIFAVGIFIGVMIVNKTESKINIEEYINTYIDETKSLQKGSYVEQLQEEIKNNVQLVLLLWFAGTTIIGIPIVLGIILFRGFCLGYTISSITVVFGVGKGIAFTIISILLQNILFVPAIISLGVSALKAYKSIYSDKRKENIKLEIVRHTIFSLLILLVLIASAVIETQVSANLLRSLIKYF